MTDQDTASIVCDASERARATQARALPATAWWLTALALAALGTSGQVRLAQAGRDASVGWSAIGLVAPVCGAAALVLLGVAWWRSSSVLPAAFAAVLAVIAAIVCWAGGTDVGGSVSDGPAPWLAGVGFAAAAVCAALAARRGEHALPAITDDDLSDVRGRVRAALRHDLGD